MSKGMLGYICAFSLGAAVGVVATWKLLERKCEQYINEEIDALRELRIERQGEQTAAEEVEGDEPESDADTEDEYMGILMNNGYVKYSDIKKLEDSDNVFGEEPYLISPDAFGMKTGYEEVCLVYYTDEVLADMNDAVIEDYEELIGDALDKFGTYEDDAVHVRNDILRRDYEILLSAKRYSDVMED